MDVIHSDWVKFISDDGPWYVKYDAPRRLPGTFFEETCKAIELIWSQRKNNVYVLYGGGLDTEFLIRAMHHLGMTATIVVIEYSDLDSSESTKRARQLSEMLKWNIYNVRFDFNHFIDDAASYELASKTQCSDFRLLPLYQTARNLDGTVLACVGSPLLIGYNNSQHDYVVYDYQQQRSAATAWNINGVHGTPFALSYTAEQFFSFLEDPIILGYTSERSPSLKDITDIKSSIYNSNPHFSLGLRKRIDPFADRRKIPFHTERIKALGYNQVCCFKYFTLKHYLRRQIP